MLRRSLILFVAFVLLGLGVTAGYSIFLRGPDDVLVEAAGLVKRGRVADAQKAVRILDMCEPAAGIRDNAPLLERLWDLRYQANQQLDNPRRALEDIEQLLRIHPERVELQLQRVYYLLRIGKNEEARRLGLDFVAGNPTNARGRELCGEAGQECFRQERTDIVRQLGQDLGPDRERDGVQALLEYLYRQDGDSSGLVALQRLQRLYEHEPRFRQSWPALQEKLRGLRERIQEALGHFLAALELAQKGGKRSNYFIASYRGASFALNQADRRDDVVAQTEIYLGNYDHVYCTEAAIDAVRAHIEDGQFEAAVSLADRFLPPKTWTARRTAGKLDDTVQDFLLLKAYSLYRLGRLADLDPMFPESAAMIEAKLKVNAVPPFVGPLAAVLRGNLEPAGPMLDAVSTWFLDQRAPLHGPDFLNLLMPLRLQLAAKLDAKPEAQVEIAAAWAKARPGQLEPLRAQAELQLRLGLAAGAMATATEILKTAPTDEVALHLLARAADRSFAESGQDSTTLLAQCIARGMGRPEYPPHPSSLLACAEAALAAQRPDIARSCARAGADSYPWSRWPRLVEARAELLAGNDEAALTVLDNAIGRDAEDTEALATWFDVSRRAAKPVKQHLARVVRSLPSSSDIAAALLANSIAEHSPAIGPLARAAVRRPDASAELLALAAQGLAETGAVEDATAALQLARTAHQKAPRATAEPALTAATIATIVAAAPSLEEPKLVELANRELQRLTLSGPVAAEVVLRAARELAPKRPRTAHLLATGALSLGDAIEWRDAESFRLAGDCALRTGQLEAAAAHLTAALSFAGGEDAAETLARLLLARGDRERARMALALKPKLTDAALAAFAEQQKPLELAQAALRADKGDLLATIVAALAAPADSTALGGELRALPAAARTEAIELCAILAQKELAASVLPRARALLRTAPTSTAAALLLARALWLSDHGKEATSIHDRLFTAGCREAALYGEVAGAAGASGYVVPPPILTEMRLRAGQTADPLPPRVLAWTFRDLADEAARAGNMELSAQILMHTLQNLPAASRATVLDAETMIRYGLVLQGLTLLEKLRAIGEPEARRQALGALYRAAAMNGDKLIPATTEKLTAAALQDLQRGEQIGPATTFLLADPKRLEPLPEELLRKVLALSLDALATGDAELAAMPLTLACATRRLGLDGTINLLDEAVAGHPAMAPFWLERAHLLAGQPLGIEALAELRAAIVYHDWPTLTLQFAIEAAEQRVMTADDRKLLLSLPPDLLGTPLGGYARGLSELRLGNGDTAAPLLAAAPARDSGFHLYATALANLMRNAAGARAQARAAFEQLAKDYPSSSLARSAGSFARQLAPN